MRFAEKTEKEQLTEEFTGLFRKLQATVIQFRIHDELLQTSEREILGPKWCEQPSKNIGDVARLRGRSLDEVVLDFAVALEFITESRHKRLMNALGGVADGPAMIVYANGKLLVNGRLARTVKQFKKPSNVERVLGKFQDENWPTSILAPKGITPKQLGNIVRNLNRGLDYIRFAELAGGRSVSWERTPNAH